MDLVEWDEDDGAQEETFFNGSFFPSELVLDAADMDIIAASPPISDEEGSPVQNAALGSDDLSVATSQRKASSEHPDSPRQVDDYALAIGATAPPAPLDLAADGSKKKKKTEVEKTRRRAVVAASSRATRAKRKREREDLLQRNQILEQEREIYLSRIAQLQTEVQAFRDSGAVNLTKENELLRVEIRKHKAFLRKIIDATQAAPELTPEEQYRLIRSGSASATGQVVGLMFTSVADSTWKWSRMPVPKFDGTLDECMVGVQPLPLGCEANAAKRCNIRIDMPWRPESPHVMRQKSWAAWTRPEVSSRMYSPFMRQVKVGVTELPTNFEKLKQPGDSDLRVFHYTEEDTNAPSRLRDVSFAVTWRATKVFPQASFPSPTDRHLDPNRGQSESKDSPGVPPDSRGTLHPIVNPFEVVDPEDPDATLIVSSSTSTEDAALKPKKEGVVRVSAPLIEGHVLRRGPKGEGCFWTVIFSVPCLDQGFAGVRNSGQILNSDFSINQNGSMLVASNVTAINELEL